MDNTKAAQELFRYLIALLRGPAEGIRDVSRGEMAVLAYLSFQKSPVNPTVLSEVFDLSTARIANTLNALEKKRYIERTHDTADRRKVTVSLTRQGSDFAKAKYDEIISGLRQLLDALGEMRCISPHFHMPLQSGSERILRSMNRQYSPRQYLDRVAMLRRTLDSPAITSDVIVGFPGETDDDFRQTLDVLEACGVCNIHAFPFSAIEPRSIA